MKFSIKEGDKSAIQKVYDSLVKCLQTQPEEIYNSERFGFFALGALTNFICDLSRISMMTKEVLLDYISRTWDEKAKIKKSVLN